MDVLTKIWVIEEDELLPAVLGHHLQDDLVKVDGWADHQGVVVCSRQAAGQRAGGARCPGGRALDEEVGDVHGVCERLKAACWHAADGTDQCQDTAIHQLAGWREKGEAERGELLFSWTHGGNRKNKYGTAEGTSPWSLPLFVGQKCTKESDSCSTNQHTSQTEIGGQGKSGVFVASCFYLLFILRICCALTTHNMVRNEIQMRIYCRFTADEVADNSIICRNPANQATVFWLTSSFCVFNLPIRMNH